MSERAMNKRVVQGSMWGAGVLLVVALVAIFNYFGMKYYQRYDWTGEKLYSLSEKTEKVLDGLFKRALITPSGTDWFVAAEGYDAMGHARPAPADFAGGAAHVDVNDVGVEFLDATSGR